MLLLWFSYYLQALCLSALGAPIDSIESQISAAGGNRKTLKKEIASPWVSSPQTRGTGDILWSCLVTLTACIYTAIHLNVRPHQGTWQFLLHKFKWVAVALFAPELVLYCAYSQFSEARELVQKLNKLRLDSGNQPTNEKDGNGNDAKTLKPKYTLTYGFYAAMGGFVANVGHIHNTVSQITLSTTGVTLLAEHEHPLDIDNDTIIDKSKANLVGKGLIILQVTWMVIQCVARKAAGYPLTLLEVHTMVHVACALLMYGLWWKKPMDVTDPTVIDTKDFEDILAVMLIETELKGRETEESRNILYYGQQNEIPSGSPSIDQNVNQHHTQLTLTPQHIPKSGDRDTNFRLFEHDQIEREKYSIREVPLPSDFEVVCSMSTGQSLQCGMGPDYVRDKDNIPIERTQMHLSVKDVRRFELAADGVKRLDILHPLENKARNHQFRFWLDPNIDPDFKRTLEPRYFQYGDFDDALWLYASNMNIKYLAGWTALSIIDPLSGNTLTLAAFLLPMIYGGVHLSAWNFEFPSQTELLMWKISCIDIMGSMIAAVIVYCIETVLALLCGMRSDPAWLINISLGPIFFFYVLSRAYIVTEAFISLRHVPIGVYSAIPWVQNIPHV